MTSGLPYRNPTTPKQKAARLLVAAALLTGELVKTDCENCGAVQGDIICTTKKGIVRRVRVVAHHDDYDQPLKVRWLCQFDHMLWHRENGPGANVK